MKFIINTANKCINTTFGCLIFLVLISSVTSCERCIKEEPRDGKLLMTLTPATLIDQQRTFQLKLVSQDAKKIVEYKNYQLKMTLSAESGDLKGTKIKYKSFDTGDTDKPADQEITSASVLKNLTHFFKGEVLEPGDTPEEKFIVEPDHGVSKLTLLVELLDVLQNNKSVTVCQGTWELGPLPEFAIEITNKEAASGKIVADNKMSLKIKRTDAGEILTNDLNKMALKIDRGAGSQAKISTAPNTDPSYTFLLKDVLPRVTFSADKKTATLDLMIEPGSDKKATFSIEPLSEWDEITPMGAAQSVEWDNGADLALKSAACDPATKKVMVTVENKGKLPLPANQAKLNWDTGNVAVTINGNQQGVQDLPMLDVGQVIVIDLDNVAFANPLVPSVNLDLKLTWSELENPVTPPLACLLTAIPVDVTLTKLDFDKLTDRITYNVKNNSLIDSINLELKCDNANGDANTASITTGLPVKLNNLVANTSSGDQALQVDFHNEDAADFNIALLFGGHPIDFKFNDGTGEKSVRVAKVHAVAKQVSLKLVDEGNHNFRDNKVQLKGADDKIKFQVSLNGNPRDLIDLNQVDKNRLKLTINKDHAGNAKLSCQGAEVVDGILGSNLKLGTGIVEMTLIKGTSAEAIFVLQLMYDKKGDGNFQSMGDPLTVEWGKDDSDDHLENLGSLFGDSEDDY